MIVLNKISELVLTVFSTFRELMAEPGESLSSTLAGLRESYNDYYVVKQPDHTEM